MLDSAKINKNAYYRQQTESNEQQAESNKQLVDINEIIHYLKSQYSDDKNKKDIILVVRTVNINEIIHYLSQHTDFIWRQEEHARNATRRSVSYAVNPFRACNDCYNFNIQKYLVSGKSYQKQILATTTTTTLFL